MIRPCHVRSSGGRCNCSRMAAPTTIVAMGLRVIRTICLIRITFFIAFFSFYCLLSRKSTRTSGQSRSDLDDDESRMPGVHLRIPGILTNRGNLPRLRYQQRTTIVLQEVLALSLVVFAVQLSDASSYELLRSRLVGTSNQQ